mgnify:CR=1 FL=1
MSDIQFADQSPQVQTPSRLPAVYPMLIALILGVGGLMWLALAGTL